jgi:hypothetical protein
MGPPLLIMGQVGLWIMPCREAGSIGSGPGLSSGGGTFGPLIVARGGGPEVHYVDASLFSSSPERRDRAG